MITVLSALVLGASGILAGVLVAVALGVVPAFRGLPPDQYIRVHRLAGQYYDRVMPPLVIGSTGVDIALAVLADDGGRVILFSAGAAAQLGVSVVSQLANVPINRRVKGTDPLRVGLDWDDPRDRWARWHLVRTVLALCAVLANAAAVAIHP
ncbi:DUF1772 domain-containing protein [Streptomyces sp. NPDC021096]|uniref:DUF1772 domain-containing protein n=1 Tax=Streptomyces sp. NPDC021096 TaxID=3154792 RepID=UPI0033E262EB